MENDYRPVVATVFCDVIERLAFMFGERCDKEELPIGNSNACTTMKFTGPWEGKLDLVLPATLSTQIASNVLGTEPDDKDMDRYRDDAVKEVLNVTCGHLLSELAGDEPIFDLSVPAVTSIDAHAWESMRDDPDSVALLIEDEPVLVRFSLHKS